MVSFFNTSIVERACIGGVLPLYTHRRETFAFDTSCSKVGLHTGPLRARHPSLRLMLYQTSKTIDVR